MGEPEERILKRKYRAIVALEFEQEWPTEEMAQDWAEAWMEHLKTDKRVATYRPLIVADIIPKEDNG